MNKQARSGYILMLALMTVSVGVVMVTSLYQVSQVYLSFLRRARLQHEARAVAYSGPQIVRAQLAKILLKEQEDKKKKTESSKSNDKIPGKPKKAQPEPASATKGLGPSQELLLLLNSWQTFELDERKDGVDATLKIYLSCEQGKVDLNHLSTIFKKQEKAKKDSIKTASKQKEEEQLFTKFFAKLGKIGGGQRVQMLKALKATLIKREYNWYDATELLDNKELKPLASQIYPSAPEPKNSTVKEVKPKSSLENQISINDLFTVDTSSSCLVPWALSRSVCVLLGIPALRSASEEKLKLLASKPIGIGKDSAKVWNAHLAPLYKKKWSALPKLAQKLLSNECGATVFSVVSYAYVGGVVHGVWTLIRMVHTAHNKSNKQEAQVRFEIVKMIDI